MTELINYSTRGQVGKRALGMGSLGVVFGAVAAAAISSSGESLPVFLVGVAFVGAALYSGYESTRHGRKFVQMLRKGQKKVPSAPTYI